MREDLLDSAQAIMLEEGYAAVSSRRVAARIGCTAALVYYYFDTMEDLFLTLFRRMADQTLERQRAALHTTQPLWALWELSCDASNAALSMEFIALANHHKSIKSEITDYAVRTRQIQVDVLTGVLDGYGLPSAEYQPVALMFFMAGISRYLIVEEAFGICLGHAEAVEIVERFLRRTEGEREVEAIDDVC